MPLAQTLLRPYRDNRQLPQVGALTLSSGVITDATRLAGVQGDGAAYPDSSVGVWPAATNLVTNGGFETNTTGWAGFGSSGETIERTTSTYKFGSACLKVTLGGIVGYDGATTGDITLTNGAAYTASAWIKCETGTINLRLRVVNTSYVSIGQATFTATTSWQRVTVTVTATADTPFRVQVLNNTGGVSTAVYYVDGVQLETGSIATPYIHTDGGAASRSAGRITLPASGIFTTTQGWFIARVKTGFAAAGPGYVPRMMSYGDAVDNGLWLAYDGGNWSIVSDASGGVGSVSAVSADGGLATSDSRTVYGGWKSDRVNVTKGTTAWPAGTARTEVPTVASAVIDIGSLSAWLTGREAACAFKWVAMGDGPYTAIDPSVVGNWGNNDPLPHMFPKSAQLTFLAHFNGDGTQYRWAA